MQRLFLIISHPQRQSFTVQILRVQRLTYVYIYIFPIRILCVIHKSGEIIERKMKNKIYEKEKYIRYSTNVMFGMTLTYFVRIKRDLSGRTCLKFKLFLFSSFKTALFEKLHL